VLPRHLRRLADENSRRRGYDLAGTRKGVVFLGERVAPAALLGTALVLAGAWLASRREA
jgi:hypothetical protein